MGFSLSFFSFAGVLVALYGHMSGEGHGVARTRTGPCTRVCYVTTKKAVIFECHNRVFIIYKLCINQGR